MRWLHAEAIWPNDPTYDGHRVVCRRLPTIASVQIDENRNLIES